MKKKTIASVAAQTPTEWQHIRPFIAFRCTLPFITMAFIFLMTACVFATVMANAVYLARQEPNTTTQQQLTIITLAFASVSIVNVLLHFFYGRFDIENRIQRYWILGAALLLSAGLIVHNVFWYLGITYDLDKFPSPNYAAFSVVGFVMCFLLAITGWYQLKFTQRLSV